MNDTKDQPRGYEQRVGHELHAFNARTNIHELPAITDYWSIKFLSPLLLEHGFEEVEQFFAKFLRVAADRAGGPAVFASLGAGDCEIEVKTAQILQKRGLGEFTIEC